MLLNEIQISRLLDQARTLIEEKKVLHAAQIYRRLIRAEPTLVLASVELASLYEKMGRLEAGVAILNEALVVNPNSDELIFLLGSYTLRLQDYDRALAYFRRIAGKKLPHVHFNMGMAYFFKNDIQHAEEQFRLTLKFDPAFPRINQSIGEILMRRQAYTEAIDYLRKGVSIDPYNAVNHFLLGTAYGKVHNWKRALGEFILSTDTDPTEASHWHMCGEALIHLRRYDEARPYLLKSLELDPHSPDALIALGHVYAANGSTDQALQCIDKALKLDAHHARALDARWKIGRGRRQHLKQS